MTEPLVRPLCKQFRQKRMYLTGADVDPTAFNADSFAHCWCLQTQDAFGPDDDRVDPARCQPGRGCFESY
ncbi:MAG: hypothetical protein IT204_20590 [Fimbriimonadaceae bacterium]|nr:hypothetical protein [Fimbriimonadaceae bacterium]